MITPSPQLLRTGNESAPTSPLALKAGPITALFEPDNAFLRYIRIGDHEILRGIYGAVRRPDWQTVPPQILDLSSDISPDTFTLRFTALCQAGDIDFRWHGTVTGDAQGRIAYRMEGEAQSSFQTNRIGLCTLHPITECAGQPCRIEHTDGSRKEGAFPKHIAPHPIFTDLRALAYQPAPGVEAEVRFAGDTFETEDQRNWSDASFKTYSTPVRLPAPVTVAPGNRIDQTVSLSLPGTPRKILPILLGRGAQLSIATTPVQPKPSIGLAIPSHSRALTEQQINRLRALRLNHLRVSLHLDQPDWEQTLSSAGTQAADLDLPLHLALRLNDVNPADKLARLRQLGSEKELRIALCCVFQNRGQPAGPELMALARQHLNPWLAKALLATGTEANFVDLNQHRPDPNASALPCFSINPQVHTTDNRSMIETLAIQPQMVESLQTFAPRAAAIGPITLQPQEQTTADPRQKSLFAAGWTLASLSRLAAGGQLHSLTYFETSGPQGIMDFREAADLNDDPWSNCVYPVYHVLADLTDCSRLYPTISSHPLQTEGLTLITPDKRRRVLVANLTDQPQEIRIKTGTCEGRLRVLDETNAWSALLDPDTFRAAPGEPVSAQAGKVRLDLLPYAIARLDLK